MSTAVNPVSPRLYETDFYGWIQQQAGVLRAGSFATLDLDNLIEEIESMGRSEQRELESRLDVLLMHLLKWQYQPNLRSKSWELTIEEQRRRISRHLRKNSSLNSLVPETLEDAYGDAVLEAAKETGLSKTTFPVQCPWTFEQVINDGYWPEKIDDQDKSHCNNEAP